MEAAIVGFRYHVRETSVLDQHCQCWPVVTLYATSISGTLCTDKVPTAATICVQDLIVTGLGDHANPCLLAPAIADLDLLPSQASSHQPHAGVPQKPETGTGIA